MNINTSFSSLRLRVPARKLVWSVSAFTSDMHRAYEWEKQKPEWELRRGTFTEIWKQNWLGSRNYTWYFKPYPMPDDPPCIAALAGSWIYLQVNSWTQREQRIETTTNVFASFYYDQFLDNKTVRVFSWWWALIQPINNGL